MSVTALEPTNSEDSNGSTTRAVEIHLYPEIWLLIFPHLKAHDLRAASLTCSMFRYMAQPMLFNVLDVSPFLLSFNTEAPILRPKSYLDRLLRRLECYRLPYIAHGVHHCWVSPYSRSGFPNRSQQDDLDPKLVISAVMAALPHFPNLSQLSWHCMDIAPEWWAVLQPLHLAKLWLNSSSIPIGTSSFLPSVRHVDLDQWPWEGRPTDHVSIHEERTEGVEIDSLRVVIHPNNTETISVPRVVTACRLFAVLTEQSYNLRTLKIPLYSIRDPNFISALEHCPNLEALCILQPLDERHRDFKLGALCPDALPALIRYEGPYTHVLQFSRQPLQQISLWGFDERPALCDPEDLVETLQGLGRSSTGASLKSLEVKVIAATLELMESFSAFGQLERLVVRSQDNPSKHLPMPHLTRSSAPVTMLYEMTSNVQLPHTLRFLELNTRLSNLKMDLASQEHETASFTEAIARNHPHLQRIEITYGIYWTGTYNAVWGRIRQNPVDGSNPLSTPPATPTGTLGPSFAQRNAHDGYSSKSSSRDYVLSTIVSTVHPLPLGKLTFTEHRRTILFQADMPVTLAGSSVVADSEGTARTVKFWTTAWTTLRKVFRL